MRSAVLLLLLACQLCPPPAHAGAWLREDGTGFSATGFTISALYDLSQSTYLEYGLRPDLTIGADINSTKSHEGLQSGAATLFLRFPLGTAKTKNRWAYDLGLGASWAGAEVVPHLKATLSWGRGFSMGAREGWLGLDASARFDFGLLGEEIKIDGTAGLDFTDMTTGMVQVFVSNTRSGTVTKIAPSVIFTPPQRKFSIQIGSEIPAKSPKSATLKLGLWRRF